MTRGLRLRLLLAFGSVAVVTAVSVAILSTWATRVELERVVAGGPPAGPLAPAVVASVAAALERDTPEAARSELERAAAGADYLLVDDAGRVLLRSPGLEGRDVATVADGSVEVTTRRGAAGFESVVADRAAPAAVVTGVDGRVLGRVFLLEAGPPPVAPPPSARVLSGRIWLAAGVVAIFAVAATAVVARRILRPVAALTDAARRMAAGEGDVLVEVNGRDELALLGRAFNEMAVRIADQERLRQHVVADVAHELRTPLTAIHCQLEAIEDGLLDSDTETMARLRNDLGVLERLVDDLQELALADSAALELRKRPVHLAELVRAAEVATAAAAPGSPVVEVRVPEDLCVAADPERLTQVLVNLLANARAYTPAGGNITVTAEAAGDQAHIVVADTGIGIAAEHLPHVFERFYRADPSRSRATGGAGIGLAIVKRMVEAHGGAVAVESQPGRGSRFTVVLARAPRER